MSWWKFWKKNTKDSYLLELSRRMNSIDEVKAEIYSSMKENDFKKLARSNYLLYELRRLLSLKTECSEWFDFNSIDRRVINIFDKADRSRRFYSNNGKFNGAELCSVHSSYPSTTIYFLDDRSLLSDSENSLRRWYGSYDETVNIEVGNIPVLFSIPPSSLNATKEMDWQALLNEANDEFERLLEREGENILSQVSRFFIQTNFYEQGKPEEAKKLIADICAEFSESQIYRYQDILPALCDSGWVYCKQKAEVILDKSLSKDEFINRMRKYIPQIEEPIFGYGVQYNLQADIPNHLTDVSIHLYARQF